MKIQPFTPTGSEMFQAITAIAAAIISTETDPETEKRSNRQLADGAEDVVLEILGVVDNFIERENEHEGE